MKPDTAALPELVVATNNKSKLKEIRELLPGWKLLTLEDIGFTDDIDEPWETFEENAREKAITVFRACGKMTLAEDSGLCIAALNGAPGVFSARYAGEPRDDRRNLEKALAELAVYDDRSAWYQACACLVTGEEEAHYFTGKCHGHLARQPEGDGGFGYDPIFIPNGYDVTFGQLSPEVKNSLSHRGQAIRQLAEFLLQ